MMSQRQDNTVLKRRRRKKLNFPFSRIFNSIIRIHNWFLIDCRSWIRIYFIHLSNLMARKLSKLTCLEHKPFLYSRYCSFDQYIIHSSIQLIWFLTIWSHSPLLHNNPLLHGMNHHKTCCPHLITKPSPQRSETIKCVTSAHHNLLFNWTKFPICRGSRWPFIKMHQPTLEAAS